MIKVQKELFMSSSIFDDKEFNQNLFLPRRDRDEIGKSDFFIQIADAKIHVRRYPCYLAKYAILFFYGSGEVACEYAKLSLKFHKIGGDFFIPNYRGYGYSTGNPSLRSVLLDATHICHEVKKLTSLPLVVMGRSLGSAAAIYLAANVEGIAACILESGYHDSRLLLSRQGIVDVSLQSGDEIFDNGENIRNVYCSTLIIHGAEDTLITPDEAEKNYSSLPGGDKEIIVLPGFGHNDILLADYHYAIGNFLGRFIRI